MAPSNERPPSRTLVLATVLFYMFAAIAMVLANKWVLMKTSVPAFFLFVQLFVAVILLAITKWVGLFAISLELDRATCKALIPMVGVNVLGLNFNNLTLKFVDASMYQVARGLLLPITVAISFVLLHSRPSSRVLLSCGIVTIGFFIGVFIDNLSSPSPSTTSGPSLVGILFGVLSSCTTALHAVVIKRSLDAVNGNTLQLAWYSNALSAMVMVPIIVVGGEVPSVLELFAGEGGVKTGVEGGQEGMSALATFVWGSALTGFVGFLICIAGFLSIKITSPITHMVSSAVRGVLQTFLSVAFFHDVITAGRGSSISVILAGSMYYTWVKNGESQAAKAYTPLPTSAPREEVLKSDAENGNGVGGGLHGRGQSEHIELGGMGLKGSSSNGSAHSGGGVPFGGQEGRRD